MKKRNPKNLYRQKLKARQAQRKPRRQGLNFKVRVLLSGLALVILYGFYEQGRQYQQSMNLAGPGPAANELPPIEMEAPPDNFAIDASILEKVRDFSIMWNNGAQAIKPGDAEWDQKKNLKERVRFYAGEIDPGISAAYDAVKNLSLGQLKSLGQDLDFNQRFKQHQRLRGDLCADMRGQVYRIHTLYEKAFRSFELSPQQGDARPAWLGVLGNLRQNHVSDDERDGYFLVMLEEPQAQRDRMVELEAVFVKIVSYLHSDGKSVVDLPLFVGRNIRASWQRPPRKSQSFKAEAKGSMVWIFCALLGVVFLMMGFAQWQAHRKKKRFVQGVKNRVHQSQKDHPQDEADDHST